MPSIEQIITDVIQAEGGATATNDPADAGGRTQYGISEKANPAAWADGVVAEKEAREIYLQKYVIGTGFFRIPSSHPKTQIQLIDWGVNSGPAIATKNLQEILKIKADGVFGAKTLEALINTADQAINNRLVAARVEMIGRVVQKNPTQLKWLTGWLKRAVSFIS